MDYFLRHSDSSWHNLDGQFHWVLLLYVTHDINTTGFIPYRHGSGNMRNDMSDIPGSFGRLQRFPFQECKYSFFRGAGFVNPAQHYPEVVFQLLQVIQVAGGIALQVVGGK